MAPHNDTRERGMVTAETALSFFVFASAFIAVSIVVSGVFSYFHAQDVSRTVARSVSLGDADTIIRYFEKKEPDYTIDVVCMDNDLVDVAVQRDNHAVTERFGVDMSAHAVAHIEPGVVCDDE